MTDHSAADERVRITVELSPQVVELLAVLTTGDDAPADVEGVILQLVDHAQQGVYRPGAWERSWLVQAFGDGWTGNLEPGDPFGRHEQRTGATAELRAVRAAGAGEASRLAGGPGGGRRGAPRGVFGLHPAVPAPAAGSHRDVPGLRAAEVARERGNGAGGRRTANADNT